MPGLRAVRYYYLQRLGFGGKTHKRTFGTSALGAPGLNILTVQVRRLFRKFNIQGVTTTYSAGNARYKATQRAARRQEVLIAN